LIIPLSFLETGLKAHIINNRDEKITKYGFSNEIKQHCYDKKQKS
jgi:hypothetical protein